MSPSLFFVNGPGKIGERGPVACLNIVAKTPAVQNRGRRLHLPPEIGFIGAPRSARRGPQPPTTAGAALVPVVGADAVFQGLFEGLGMREPIARIFRQATQDNELHSRGTLTASIDGGTTGSRAGLSRVGGRLRRRMADARSAGNTQPPPASKYRCGRRVRRCQSPARRHEKGRTQDLALPAQVGRAGLGNGQNEAEIEQLGDVVHSATSRDEDV